MSEFERQLKFFTAGRSTGSGAASGVASSELHPEPMRRSVTVHSPTNQRTVLVVGGFALDTREGCDERKVERSSDTSQASKTGGLQGWSDQWESSASTRTFLSKYKGRKFSHGLKQLLVHLGSPERGSPPLQEGLTGDKALHIRGGGERLLDEWSRDGHRWRLGAGPCVVQKTEDGGSGHHDLQADQQLLLGSGVHRRIDTGLG